MERLLSEIRRCRLCEEHLLLGPRPVLQAHATARLVIIGQAPGKKVHLSGIPWDDASGKRLRAWLMVSEQEFYDPRRIAIVPSGFCYPGKGKSGDLPPRPECAPKWHPPLLAAMPSLRLTLLIGAYAQQRYLGARRKRTLTETVRAWREYEPDFLVIPHPSPRNRFWLTKNPWFEMEVVPYLQQRVRTLLEA